MALDAVATEGTFGRAATRLGYTQSAVSQQIAALERMVGAPLFDRPGGPRPVTLTPLGELVLQPRSRCSRSRRRGRPMRSSASWPVTSGGSTSARSRASRRSCCPRSSAGCGATIRRSTSACSRPTTCTTCIAGSSRGELDVAFTIGDIGTGLETLELLYDPFVLVARPGEVPDGAVPTADLDGRAMIGEPRGRARSTSTRV